MSPVINRTRRKLIAKRHVHISVSPANDGGPPTFTAQVELQSYGFKDDAEVCLEVSRSNASQRWSLGTIRDPAELPDTERQLTDVPIGGIWRLSVVAGDGSGLLLGHAPRLRAVLPLDSLLPLDVRDDLGDEVWRVDFDSEEGVPVLLVNGKIETISDIVRNDAEFRALVLPEVFRTILTRMVLIDHADPGDDGPWERWYETARRYGPIGIDPPYVRPEDDQSKVDDAKRWIDQVVGALAKAPLHALGTYSDALRQRHPQIVHEGGN